MDVSFVTRAFYGFAIAMVICMVLGVIVGKLFGGANKRLQKLTAQLVFGGGMVIFMLLIFPRLLGIEQ